MSRFSSNWTSLLSFLACVSSSQQFLRMLVSLRLSETSYSYQESGPVRQGGAGLLFLSSFSNYSIFFFITEISSMQSLFSLQRMVSLVVVALEQLTSLTQKRGSSLNFATGCPNDSYSGLTLSQLLIKQQAKLNLDLIKDSFRQVIMIGFLICLQQPVVPAVNNYYTFHNSCFKFWVTGIANVPNVDTKLPIGGASAVPLVTATFTSTLIGSPLTCGFGLSKLSHDTNNINFYQFQLTRACTVSSISLSGTVPAGRTILALQISYAASTHPNVRLDFITNTVTNTNNNFMQTFTYISLGTVDTSKNPQAIHFLCGFKLQKTSGDKQSVFLLNGQAVVGSSSIQIKVNTDQDGSRVDVKKLSVTVVIAQTSLLSNSTFLKMESIYGDEDINGPGNQINKNANLMSVYLPNNYAFGLRGFVNKVNDQSVTSIVLNYVSVSSSDYNFKATAQRATKIRAFGFHLVNFYGPNCQVQSKFLNLARNDCVAACPSQTFSDSCNICWPCHYTCFACTAQNQANKCTDCNTAVSHRDLNIVSAPEGTCDCGSGFLESSTPNTFICQPCHYTCVTCSNPNQWDKCLTCSSAANRNSQPQGAQFSCPCIAGFLEVSQVCQPCGPNCSGCTGTTANCNGCAPTFWLDFLAHTCSTSCPSGQFESTTAGFCSMCSAWSFCQTCVTSSTNCLSCLSPKKLLGNNCVNSCPHGKYADSARVCQNCPSICTRCVSPTQCKACTTGNALLNGACVLTCPSTHIRTHNAVSDYCYDCDVSCVQLTSLKFSYLEPALQPTSPLRLTATFNKPIDNFEDFIDLNLPFNYTKNFSVSDDGLSYFINIYPLDEFSSGQVEGISVSYKPHILGSQGQPMKPSSWKRPAQLFKFFYMFDRATQMLSAPSDAAYNLSKKIPNELRAMLSFASPSFQLTSCILFTNFTLPKHFYDGLRIISLGNLYDIPPWHGGNQWSRTVIGGPTVKELNVTRLLQDSQVPYSLSRTSLGSYFLFNFYIQLGVLLLTLIINLVVQLLYSYGKCPDWLSSIAWSWTDFVHEFIIMYLVISTSIQMHSFSKQGSVSLISAVISVVCILQFVAYELTRFYRFNSLINSEVGSSNFHAFLTEFGHLIKNLRFQESKASWWLLPWISPSYYHLISPIKKALMMLSFSLFAENYLLQIGIVGFLQFLQLLRFLLLKPYAKLWRNIARGLMELLMTVQFILLVYLGYVYNNISLSNKNTYNILGWVLLSICYLFNLYYLLMLPLNLYEKWRGESNLIIEQRKRSILEDINERGDSINVDEMTKLVAAGNLNNANLRELPDIEFKIEQVVFSKQQDQVSVKIYRVLQMKMGKQGGMFNQVNNTFVTKKINKTVLLKGQSISLIPASAKNQLKLENYLMVKTFTFIPQSKLNYDQRVDLYPYCQEMTTIRNGRPITIKFSADRLLEGFPLDLSQLKKI